MEVGEKENKKEGDGMHCRMDSPPSLILSFSLFFQYVWGTDEEYLFKAMVAFAMRKVPNRETTE